MMLVWSRTKSMALILTLTLSVFLIRPSPARAEPILLIGLTIWGILAGWTVSEIVNDVQEAELRRELANLRKEKKRTEQKLALSKRWKDEKSISTFAGHIDSLDRKIGNLKRRLLR